MKLKAGLNQGLFFILWILILFIKVPVMITGLIAAFVGALIFDVGDAIPIPHIRLEGDDYGRWTGDV